MRASVDRVIRTHLGRKPTRVIDPACGPGLWLAHFHAAGAEVAGCDLEEAAIEAGANEVEKLTHAQNDDIPTEALGARFITDRTNTHAVSQWLLHNGWTVVTSEIGYLAKSFPILDEAQQNEVGTFLQSLEDHDDIHRVWAAIK